MNESLPLIGMLFSTRRKRYNVQSKSPLQKPGADLTSTSHQVRYCYCWSEGLLAVGFHLNGQGNMVLARLFRRNLEAVSVDLC